MSPLVPCPGCRRHVRSAEPACPFCAADLGALPAPMPYDERRLRGLGRAAMVVFGAAIASGAVGCDSSPSAVDAGMDGGVDAGMDGGADAGMDAGPVGLDAAYGGPPFDAWAAGDAYGAPPVDAAFTDEDGG